jgi:YNFM family putative membrane transporter
MVATRVVPWRPLVFKLALVAMAVGFGTFGATTALGDVAKAFGTTTGQSSFTARVGLSGSTLGLGLGVLRAASLAALPLAALGDRWGRRRILYLCGVTGLCVTALASLSPSYWWFVALFAIARPVLSAASSLATVMTAELTGSRMRITALAVLSAGAAVGAGLNVILHGALRGSHGFRILFAAAIIPAVAVAALVRRLPETHGRTTATEHAPRLGAIPRALWGRLAIVMGVFAAVNAINGPAGGFAFVYSEDILKLSPRYVSTVVTLSALTGVAGLLVGRWIADRHGRRPAVAIGMLAIAATSLYAYSGGRTAFSVGYVVGVFAAAMWVPGMAALSTESFPESVRASSGGWVIVAGVLGALAGITVFSVVADASYSSGTHGSGSLALAAAAAFLPALPVCYFLRRLPETKGAALT